MPALVAWMSPRAGTLRPGNSRSSFQKRFARLIPCGRNKRPLLKWRQYQHRAATIKEALEWRHELKPSSLAVVTGQISGLVVLDFDDVLFVSLVPHVRTPSGGVHIYFEHPGWRVPTLNSKTKEELGLRWPGLDIRADGGYTVGLGKTDRGYYEWLCEPRPYPLHIKNKRAAAENLYFIDERGRISKKTVRSFSALCNFSVKVEEELTLEGWSYSDRSGCGLGKANSCDP